MYDVILKWLPPARVYLFKLSSLAKGILLANFSPFGNLGSKKCQTAVIPVKKTKFFQILVLRMQKFGKFCQENAKSWHF